jgi:hypothetical protein
VVAGKAGVLLFRGEKTIVCPIRRFYHKNIYLEQQKHPDPIYVSIAVK